MQILSDDQSADVDLLTEKVIDDRVDIHLHAGEFCLRFIHQLSEIRCGGGAAGDGYGALYGVIRIAPFELVTEILTKLGDQSDAVLNRLKVAVKRRVGDLIARFDI